MANKHGKDQEQQEEERVRLCNIDRKMWWVMSGLLVLMIVLALSISLPILIKKKRHHEQNLFTMCESTRYPDVCLASLQSIRSSAPPREILEGATEVASRGVEGMLNMTIDYRNRETHSAELDPALTDCIELLGSAVEELQSSLEEFRKGGYESEITDIQTWMSAALTYHDTCMDELEDVELRGDAAAEHLKKRGRNVEKLLSNALAFVNPLVAAYRASKTVHVDRGLVNGAHRVDAIVAQDGSGHFRRIQDALNAAPRMSPRRYVIHIRAGIYREYVTVRPYHANIMFVGDGQGRTIITGNRNVKQPGVTTISSATVAIMGKNFMAREITIENTSGPDKGQAVALRVGADQAAFYRCSIHGYQDTLLAHVFRQFYRECTVTGTVDFVFGNAAAVFQNCSFESRVPLHGQQTVVTAQARSDPAQNTGFSFHMCRVGGAFPVYLGRPWKEYARVVWLRSQMDALVQPSGWLTWIGTYGLQTSYFAEYRNYGPGSSTRNRVKWAKVIGRSRVARKFTPVNFIAASSWLPKASVIFDNKL